jgi:hypothetical protein
MTTGSGMEGRGSSVNRGWGLDTPPTGVDSNSLKFCKLFQIYFFFFMNSMFNFNILFDFQKHEHFVQVRLDKLSKVCFYLLQCSLKYLYLSLSLYLLWCAPGRKDAAADDILSIPAPIILYFLHTYIPNIIIHLQICCV